MDDRSSWVPIDIKLLSFVVAGVDLALGLSFWWTYGDQIPRLFR